jgi:RimJ/RimL family protein N-acetyltransferase
MSFMLGYSLSSSIFTDCWHDFGQIVKLRHRGIGYDAVKTVMKYAFEELQLHRLESSIIASNEAPAKLLCEKLGWSEEGVKRQALFKRGAYHDVKIMGIVSEDYLKLKQ